MKYQYASVGHDVECAEFYEFGEYLKFKVVIWMNLQGHNSFEMFIENLFI